MAVVAGGNYINMFGKNILQYALIPVIPEIDDTVMNELRQFEVVWLT